jgi:Chalcone isomerase-like
MTTRLQPMGAVLGALCLCLNSFGAYAQNRASDNTLPPVALRISESLTSPPPAELLPYSTLWNIKGRGALRFFGFKAYDATLWLPGAEKTWSFARQFALEIRYATAIKGKDISNTSLIELQRISPSSPEQIAAWAALMDALFVDVKPGDQLTGVHLPGIGVRFFLNGKFAGESPDLAFSEAFFRIWLDPKTKRPDLRTALLSVTDPQAR